MKCSLLLLFLFVSSVHVCGQKLYIFIPSEHAAIDIERKLTENLPGVAIRSFGSIIDFKNAVLTDTPDAIITKPQVLPYLRSYTIKLNGQINGSISEPFFILSVGDPISLNSLEDKNIGILDFLGRKQILDFTATLFDTQPKLKRVKKMADLLPLISLNLVDGVAVSETQAAYLKKRSNLSFSETKCKKNQAVAVLALFRDNNKIVETIKKMPTDMTLLIGVDGWN